MRSAKPGIATARRARLALPAVLSLLFAVLCLASTTGCSHYQLGTGSTAPFRTLYIEPVTNTTLLPQSRALLTTQLRERFLRDGRVSLVNAAAGADATLTVAIDTYLREIATGRPDDTGLARKFNLTLGVTCTLRDNRANTLILDKRAVTAQREAFTDGGQLQSEYQVLPLLAESLAGKVVHAALDTW